jgi:hypothetical protein
MHLISITNSGPDITATNYWETEHAHGGFCYLSANAGTWRLLVPPEAETLLAEMRTGKKVSIEPSLHAPGRCWDVVFDDGTSSPFSVAIDKKQVDRAMLPGRCRLTVWTVGGKVLDFACVVKLK